MAQVDSALRSDVLSAVERFRTPAFEPLWTEFGEPTGPDSRLVFCVTRHLHDFGSPGAFWVHALFNHLEDRAESEDLPEVARGSLCREATPTEAVDVIESRIGRPLEESERATMLMSDVRKPPRVFLMLASEALWAGLIQADDACVALFLESLAKR